MSRGAYDAFMESISNHVPPEAAAYNPDNETTLRSKQRYRVRVRGSDQQYEVVGRFTGFTVPEDGATEVLILEFVAEHSYADPADQDEKGSDA